MTSRPILHGHNTVPAFPLSCYETVKTGGQSGSSPIVQSRSRKVMEVTSYIWISMILIFGVYPQHSNATAKRDILDFASVAFECYGQKHNACLCSKYFTATSRSIRMLRTDATDYVILILGVHRSIRLLHIKKSVHPQHSNATDNTTDFVQSDRGHSNSFPQKCISQCLTSNAIGHGPSKGTYIV